MSSLPPNKYSIHWHPAALVVFYRLPISSATMIDRAIIHLAETGEGRLEWLSPYHRLRVGTFNVVLVLDAKCQALYVLTIYRATTERIH